MAQGSLNQTSTRDVRCKRKVIDDDVVYDHENETEVRINPKLATRQLRMAKVPRLMCIKSSALPDGTTFSDWVKGDENLYIATQKKKYIKDAKENSKWCHGNLSWKLYKKEITVDEFLQKFEQHVRDNLWNDLDELTGATMGCWCEDESMCHGGILKRLYKEKMINKAQTRKKN